MVNSSLKSASVYIYVDIRCDDKTGEEQELEIEYFPSGPSKVFRIRELAKSKEEIERLERCKEIKLKANLGELNAQISLMGLGISLINDTPQVE